MFRSLKEAPFVVVDTETTGITKEDRLWEVGVIFLDEELHPVDKWEKRINPCVPMHPKAIEVHGVSDADVAKEPFFDDIFHDLMQILNHRICIGHNIQFDMDMLKRSFLEYRGVSFKEGTPICTMKLADPHRKYIKLVECVEKANIDFPESVQHSALGDAEATARLLWYQAQDKKMILGEPGEEFPEDEDHSKIFCAASIVSLST